MIRFVKNRVIFLSVLLSALNVCLAQTDSATYTFSFDNTTAPVYDLSGPYTFTLPVDGAGNLVLGLSFGAGISQDQNGKLTGSGVTLLYIGTESVAASYDLKGKISRSGGVTRVNFSVKLNGDDIIAGKSTKFSASISYQTQVDPETLTLVGRARGNLNIQGSGSSRIRDDDVSVALPPGVDGSWTLQLNFLPLKQFAGIATIVVSNYTSPDNPAGEPTERVLTASLTGSYSEQN